MEVAAMFHTPQRVMPRVPATLVALMAAAAMGCAAPMGVPDDASSFSAEISGARNERLAGSAAAGVSWGREVVVQVTLPQAGTFSSIVLAGSDLRSTISLSRAGSELPVGSHRIGRIPNTTPGVTPMLTGSYVIREGENLRVFNADSGSVTITESGQRVRGSFTLYASQYAVMKAPTPAQIGQLITPISSGTAPLTITGSFDAGRR
jgi:hypothetical protein